MTENVANVDIEDVLSSIRRLVSDESIPRKVASVEGAAEDNSPKLVLTPALRIIPDEAEAETDEARELDEGVSAHGDLRTLESTIEALEAAVGVEADEWEPDGSENEPILDPPPAIFDELRNKSAANVDAEPERDEANVPDIGSANGRRLNLTLPEEPQEPVSEIAEETQDEVPEAPRIEPLVLDASQVVAPEVIDEGLAGFASFDDVEPEPEPEPEVEAELEAEAEAVDGAEYERAVEPGPGDHAQDAQALAPPDTSEYAAGEDARPVSVASIDNTGEADEVLLDEETLQTMIAMVVREELRGAFGEEVTRNLRKLIRREIHAYFDVGDGK